MTGVTIDHYELIEELGAGGMGKVYKARDLRLDRLVALKILFGRSFSEQDRLRFIQEAKTASALNHPNIITVYEVVSVSGNDVIVMELIEGRTLGSVAREKPGVMALLPIFRQIAEALSVAHAAGIVHRDIKPDNIMVRADGYVKVLDFGLARLDSLGVDERTATLGLTEPGAIIGTLRYMSPEQVRGETVGPAADIFSLGITLFEVLTGQHAFSVSSSLGVLNAILVEPARPAARINPEIPAVVDDLISRMLSKEPVLRPTASEIQQTLASLLTTGNAPWTPLRTVAQPARSSVGREEEHSALREAFSDASAGAWSMICVAGEPGLGKTTLVEDFLRDTQTEFGRAWVTTGRCSERLSGAEALLPWLESLEHLIRGDRGDEAARLLRRYAPAWFLLVAPGMGDATREAVVLDAKTPSHELMRRELVAFLEQLCRVQPLILFFDDVHWADASTCDLLSYIAAKAQGLPMLVAATYRPAMLMASRHPFLQVKLQLQGRGCCREVPLRFLTRSDVERYAARVFPQHQFPSDFFEVIHSKTEGNPLFMTDMLRYLRDRKSIVEQEGRWALVEPLSHVAKEIPSNIRGMIQMKMDALGEEDRQLLVAGATQGVEFDSAVAANVLNRDPIDVEERLQLLETTSDFVRAMGENEMPNRTLSVRYRFVHVFYQNAMYASLTPSRRAALSRNVARTLVEYHGQRARSLAGELAALFDAARDFPEAAKYYLFASRNAARVFAYPEAAILAKKGLEAAHALPDSSDRAQLELPLSLTLGVSQMATLGYSAPEVLQTHLRSRDLCRKVNDTRRMVPILWGLWTSYLIGGQIRNSLAVAEEMMQIAEASGQPLLLIQALHAMGTTAFYIGTLQESQRRLERLLEIYDPRKHDFSQLVYLMDPVVSAHSMLSRACMLQGSIDRALNHGRQAVSIAEASAHVPSIAYAHFFLAWVLLGVGEYAAARDSAARSMKISAEHGNTQTGEWGRILYGASISHMGDPQGVIEMRQSLAGQAAVYSRIESGYCSALLAEGLAALGRFDEALEVVNHGLEMAVGLDENAYIPEILRLKAEVLLAKSSRGTAMAVGESERTDSSLVQMAEDELRTSIDFARSSSARLLELQAWCSLLRLKQLTGETTEVKRELAQCLASFTEGLQSPHLRDARVLLSS